MSDLSKALDKIMSLPTKEAKEYAKQYVAGLRESDNVAMPTCPDVVRSAILKQVSKRKPDEDYEDDGSESGSADVGNGKGESDS